MARQISLIQQQILDAIAADTTIGPQLTSASKRAIYRLLAFIVAAAIGMVEQLMDIFSASIEATAAAAAPASYAWLQAQIFKFQYSSSIPQLVQFINFAPSYPVEDLSLRIITRCSVTTSLSNSVLIKVAKGTTPGPLSVPEVTALTAYVNPPFGIGVAGINYVVSSKDSDKLYVQASIFYQGTYSNVIKQNVINAINDYLAALPFNGQMKISDLEKAIRNVEGVNDVVLVNVAARPNATVFGSGTFLVQANNVMSRLWATDSGYMVSETTSGQTLSDSLTFTAE